MIATVDTTEPRYPLEEIHGIFHNELGLICLEKMRDPECRERNKLARRIWGWLLVVFGYGHPTITSNGECVRHYLEWRTEQERVEGAPGRMAEAWLVWVAASCPTDGN